MTDEKKTVALVDEEDAAALMYHYVDRVRRHASPDRAEEWNESADAEVRRLLKKASYFAGLLDDLEKRKNQQPANVAAIPRKTSGAISRTVSGA